MTQSAATIHQATAATATLPELEGAESTREEQLDRIARALRDSRTGRSTPATDDEWARSKARFPGNYRCLCEEAARAVDDGSLFEDQ